MAHLDKQEDRKYWNMTISINNKERSVSLRVQDDKIARLILDRVNRLEEAVTVGFTASDVGLQEWLERIELTNPPLYTLIQEKMNSELEITVTHNESEKIRRKDGKKLSQEFRDNVVDFVRKHPGLTLQDIKQEFHLGNKTIGPGNPLRVAIDEARGKRQYTIPMVNEGKDQPTNPNPDQEKKESLYYTVKEVALKLNVSPTTVYCKTSDGSIPSIRVNSAIRIPKKEFEKCLKSQKKKEGPSK